VFVFATNLPYSYQIHAYGKSVGARSTDCPTSVCRRYNFLFNNPVTHFGSNFCQGIRKASPKNLAKFSVSLSSPTLNGISLVYFATLRTYQLYTLLLFLANELLWSLCRHPFFRNVSYNSRQIWKMVYSDYQKKNIYVLINIFVVLVSHFSCFFIAQSMLIRDWSAKTHNLYFLHFPFSDSVAINW
jgi:hypothetical protein